MDTTSLADKARLTADNLLAAHATTTCTLLES